MPTHRPIAEPGLAGRRPAVIRNHRIWRSRRRSLVPFGHKVAVTRQRDVDAIVPMNWPGETCDGIALTGRCNFKNFTEEFARLASSVLCLCGNLSKRRLATGPKLPLEI